LFYSRQRSHVSVLPVVINKSIVFFYRFQLKKDLSKLIYISSSLACISSYIIILQHRIKQHISVGIRQNSSDWIWWKNEWWKRTICNFWKTILRSGCIVFQKQNDLFIYFDFFIKWIDYIYLVLCWL